MSENRGILERERERERNNPGGLVFLTLLCFCNLPAVADVVSTAYVDEMAESVQSEIDGLVNKDGFEPNLVLQTDSNGNVTAGLVKTNMIADGAIQTMHIADGTVTDADLAAGLGLDKLDWGTLPTDGNLYIPIWNGATNEYVFELYEDGLLHCKAPKYNIGFDICVDANINGTSYSPTNASGATPWSVTFGYGKITGVASCNNTSGPFDIAMDKNFSATLNGRYCWCKMTSPSASLWVYRGDFGANNTGACTNWCAHGCGDDMSRQYIKRSAIYGSVGI